MTRRVRGANWNEHWDRRAERARNPRAAKHAPYNRDTDPLLACDLREVWAELTDEEVHGRQAPCPSPDHDDHFPSCRVWESGFKCYGCSAGGSIIDLGALLFGIEPRGAGFFQIRERLLADLGMADERAA